MMSLSKRVHRWIYILNYFSIGGCIILAVSSGRWSDIIPLAAVGIACIVLALLMFSLTTGFELRTFEEELAYHRKQSVRLISREMFLNVFKGEVLHEPDAPNLWFAVYGTRGWQIACLRLPDDGYGYFSVGPRLVLEAMFHATPEQRCLTAQLTHKGSLGRVADVTEFVVGDCHIVGPSLTPLIVLVCAGPAHALKLIGKAEEPSVKLIDGMRRETLARQGVSEPTEEEVGLPQAFLGVW